MNSFNERAANTISYITRSTWLVLLSLLTFTVVLKLMYIFAAQIWRVDLFYHIQSAKTILDGGVLFRDFGNSHPAGIVFIHWCLMKLFGYENIAISLKIAALLSQTGTAFFVYKIIKRGYNNFIAYISALIFIIALSINWQLWPANIMLLYLLPTIAGVYCIYSNLEKQSYLPYFIGGLLFSISTLLCTNVIFYTLLVPVLSYYSCRNIKLLIYHSMIGFIGFMIPMAFNFGYFYHHNALGDYYLWNVKWASIYASYKPFYTRFISFFTGIGKTWEWIPLVIFSFYGLYILLKKKLYSNDSAYFFALVVFIISVITRLSMVRSVIRYSLYLLPGLIILVPIAIQYFDSIKSAAVKKYVKVFIAVFLVGAFSFTNFTAYSVSRNFIDYKRGNLHKWIKENTSSDDSIFVWYEGYEVYFKTGRKMATSIFSTAEFLDHVGVWEANNYKDIDLFWKRFIDDFKRDKPLLLVDLKPDFIMDNNWHRANDMKKYFDIFKEYLDQNYKPLTVIDGAQIYIRID